MEKRTKYQSWEAMRRAELNANNLIGNIEEQFLTYLSDKEAYEAEYRTCRIKGNEYE